MLTGKSVLATIRPANAWNRKQPVKGLDVCVCVCVCAMVGWIFFSTSPAHTMRTWRKAGAYAALRRALQQRWDRAPSETKSSSGHSWSNNRWTTRTRPGRLVRRWPHMVRVATHGTHPLVACTTSVRWKERWRDVPYVRSDGVCGALVRTLHVFICRWPSIPRKMEKNGNWVRVEFSRCGKCRNKKKMSKATEQRKICVYIRSKNNAHLDSVAATVVNRYKSDGNE